MDALDWACLQDAAAVQRERRARWVWHEAAAATVVLLRDGPAQRHAALQASDAFSVLADGEACMAAAAACRTAVATIGKTAARVVADVVYRGCRPPLPLIADTLGSVPTVDLGGRLYVI